MSNVISFNSIPTTVLTPGVYIETDNSKAIGGVSVDNHRNLLIGQRLPSGTVEEAIPTRLTNEADAEEFFGRGSMLAEMLKAFFQTNDSQETWAIALDDNTAGAQAESTITVGGTATVSGTFNLIISGKRVDVAVSSGDASTTIATAITTAIMAETDLPVTAVVSASVVTLTAIHKGISGNDIDVRYNYYTGESLPKGMTVTLTSMSGGTSNPDVTTAIAALGSTHYHTIVMPYTDSANLIAIDVELEKRYGGMDQRQGSVYCARKATFSALTTFGDTLNSKHISVMAMPSVPEQPCVWAATEAARVAFHEEIDPARPYQTLPLSLMAPKPEDDFTDTEREQLLKAGLSTFLVASGQVQIQRLVTMYTQNQAGIVDPSYRDLNVLHTLGFIRFALRAMVSLRFPRYKIASNGTRFAPGQAITTPDLIRDQVITLSRKLEERGIVESVDTWKDQIIVVRNPTDVNRVDIQYPADVINQLRVTAGQLQYKL